MASIVENGLLEPIIVRPVNGELEVVAGNRRLEACRRLGFARILAHIVELDDKEAYEVSLAENLQRKTLDPLEEAEAFKRYVEDFGYGGESDLARRIGKSVSYVSRRIALLRIPKRLREELLRRRKAPGIAQELLSLGESEMIGMSDLLTEGESLTKREVRRVVRRLKNSRPDFEAGMFSRVPRIEIGEARRRLAERAISKSIAAMELCADRLGDVTLHLDDGEWFVSQVIRRHRDFLNSQVDELIRLKKKMAKNQAALF